MKMYLLRYVCGLLICTAPFAGMSAQEVEQPRVEDQIVEDQVDNQTNDQREVQAPIEEQTPELADETEDQGQVGEVEEPAVPEEEQESPVDDQPSDLSPQEPPADDQPPHNPPQESPVDDQPSHTPPKEDPVDEQPSSNPPQESPADDQPPHNPPQEPPVDDQPPHNPPKEDPVDSDSSEPGDRPSDDSFGDDWSDDSDEDDSSSSEDEEEVRVIDRDRREHEKDVNSDLSVEEDKYLEAGERPLSSDQEVSLVSSDEAAEPSNSDLEKDSLAVKEALAAVMNTQENMRTSSEVYPGLQALKKAASVLYITTHPGAFHWPLAVSLPGDKVELEDGSIWAIHPSDRYAVLNWYSTDSIVITPNHEWFSSYAYRLNNQNTGVSVAANLSLFLSPVYHTIYNHIIVRYDDSMRCIILEDGSIWSILPQDYSEQWIIGDTVIIGVNDGWYSSTRPNILINANLNRTVRANCLN